MIVTALIFLSIFLSVYYVVVCVVLHSGLLRLPKRTEPASLTYSVVIAAHNEQHNISSCLESVFGQSLNANRFEVILVDDRCTDKTVEIAKKTALNRPNFKIIPVTAVPPRISPKKNAVLTGISHTRNDVIVLTDADCVVGPKWLETIDCFFEPEVGVVQGITLYRKPTGLNPIFYGLQAIDFLSHAIVAAAAMALGFPLNSNANNLAFRREAFESAGEYGNLSCVVSGDDDLLVQRIWKQKRWDIVFASDRDAVVYTMPSMSLKEAFEQRKRWGSKTIYYNKPQVFFLAGIFAFYCAVIVCFALGFWKPHFFKMCLAMLAVKMGAESLVMIKGMRLFGRLELLLWLIPASLLHVPMIVASVFCGVFGTFTWKQQKFSRTTV